MGRRRKKVVKGVRRKLPEYFLCPGCGKNTIKVFINKKNKEAFLICGSCELRWEVAISNIVEPVDIYCNFVDQFYDEPRI